MSYINHIKPDTDLSKINIQRLPWDVVIYGKPYYAVRIPGYPHSIGGHFGENEFYAHPRNEEPTYQNLIDFDCVHPVCWGIKYEPHNYTRTKYETRVSSSVDCTITRNGEDFYTLHGDSSLYRAQALIDEINEHPLSLNEIDFDQKMLGRKVWWRSEPGIITRYIPGQACVIIAPDDIECFSTPPEFEKECNGESYYEETSVKTTIFDRHIWWFRD